MSIQPTEAPADVTAATDNLRHIYFICHEDPPTAAVCGAPRNVPAASLQPLATAKRPEHLCVVCEDLQLAPCPTCDED